RLLLRVRERSPHQQAYLQQLLAAFPASGTTPGQGEGPPEPARERSPRAQPLADPLSERELEVLQLLAEGRANAEIAARLVIEVSTVKRHVSNILAKLSASNRTQAVARARELRLLPTP